MSRILLFCSFFISLTSSAQLDLALVDIYPVDYVSTGSVKNFHPICHNFGTVNVDYSDITVSWQIDGGAISTSVPQNTTPSFLIAGQRMPLESTTMDLQAPNTAGEYTLKVWVTAVGSDINANNDTITQTIKVIDELPQKNVVMKMFKHLTCGPCYPADTITKNQIDILPQYNTVNIYTGANDIIYSAQGDSLDNYAHPTVVFDHFEFPSEPFSLGNNFYSLNGQIYLENLYEREEFLEPVAVSFASLNIDTNNRTIVAEVAAEFYDDLTDDLRFNVYILEDSILAYQASAPDPNNYYHTRVLRTMLGGTWGLASSIPQTVNTGQTVNHTFNYSVPAGYDMTKLRLIAIVQKYNASLYDRRMLNSAQVFSKDYIGTSGIEELETNSLFKVFPNPADAQLHIEFNTEHAMKRLKVMSLSGQTLIESAFANSIDISQLATGSYYLVVSDDQNSYTRLFIKE